MELKDSKKAQHASDSAPFYIIFVVAVNILFISFILVVNHFASNEVDAPEGLDAYLANQRFLRSPNCFVYEDISGRAYPLTLEWNKFTEENLNNCYTQGKDTKAVRLRLSFTEAEKNIQTKNWDDEKGPDKVEQPIPVLVYHKNQRYTGKLTIGVQDV